MAIFFIGISALFLDLLKLGMENRTANIPEHLYAHDRVPYP